MPKPTPRRSTASSAVASKASAVAAKRPTTAKAPAVSARRPAAARKKPAAAPKAPEAALKRAAAAPVGRPLVDGSPHVNPEGEFLWESSPSRYIARMSSVTGREVLRPIDPDELLIQAHRDKNPLEVTAQFLASRLIQVTGNEDSVRDAMKKINELGTRVAGRLGQMTGSKTVERGARQMIGVVDREFFFQFREATRLSEREVKARITKLQEDARMALAARGRNPKLRVLLTGATGFLGQEILAQAASDRRIAEIVSVIRPQSVRDPKTKEVVRVLSPTDRGLLLLSRLGIGGRAARKFRFVDGDIEKPFLGIGESDLATIEKTITHVIHCAASVSFDDTYENSFRANVGGCKNALAFSLRLQRAKGSKFIHHVAIETSYIHGRKKRSMAAEHALVFPKNFYNNFYELTKAMASMETDQHMVVDGLRVIQLLPAIVIGDSRTGNNRGDTKVVNAPVNAFGRAKEALDALKSTPFGESKAAAIASVAMVFPADRSAELNLVTVDRVVEGSDRRAGPPRHRQPDPDRGHHQGREGRARRQRAAHRPDPVPKRHPPPHHDDPEEGEGAEARERPREARDDLRRLRRVGPADPQRRQRRAGPRSAPPAPQHLLRLPDALPAQQARSGVREGEGPRRDRPP